MCMSSPSPLSLLNSASAWAVYVVKDFLRVLNKLFLVFYSSCNAEVLSYGNSFSTTFLWIYMQTLMLWPFQLISWSSSHWALTHRHLKNRRQTELHTACMGSKGSQHLSCWKEIVFCGLCFRLSGRGHVLYFVACYCFKKDTILNYENYNCKTWIKIPIVFKFNCFTQSAWKWIKRAVEFGSHYGYAIVPTKSQHPHHDLV